MKKSYRTVFNADMTPYNGGFRLHVLGYRVLRTTPVDVPHGTPSWFLSHFHDPVVLGTKDGAKKSHSHTFIIDAPGQPIRQNGSIRWQHSWIRVSGRAVPEMIAGAALKPGIPYHLENERESLCWLETIDDLMNHPRGADEEGVRRIVEIWLHRVRFLQEEKSRAPVPEEVLRARKYIESHYQEGLQLHDIAAAVSLSTSQLNRLFRRYQGTSLMEYTIRCRVHHARELLQTTALSVGDVALQSGFSDVYYFSRLYKKRQGYPPKRERQ